MCGGAVMAIVMGCKCGEGRGVYGARSAPYTFLPEAYFAVFQKKEYHK